MSRMASSVSTRSRGRVPQRSGQTQGHLPKPKPFRSCQLTQALSAARHVELPHGHRPEKRRNTRESEIPHPVTATIEITYDQRQGCWRNSLCAHRRGRVPPRPAFDRGSPGKTRRNKAKLTKRGEGISHHGHPFVDRLEGYLGLKRDNAVENALCTRYNLEIPSLRVELQVGPAPADIDGQCIEHGIQPTEISTSSDRWTAGSWPKMVRAAALGL